MRITCPNCGAQYEVDEALIPEGGRDVQCSACGKGWFQSREETPAEPEPVVADPIEARSEPVGDPGDEAAPDETTPEDTAPAQPVADAADTAPEAAEQEAPQRPRVPPPAWDDASEEDLDAAPAPSAAFTPPPRKTDETILAVLREEAEREIAQRRQESATLESQPELALPEAPSRPAAPRPVDAAEVGRTRQQEILPDLDAINSSLRSTSDRPDAYGGEAMVEKQRRGFRIGFGLMLMIAVALVSLYVGAEWLAGQVPALGPMLAAYVEAANALRNWIDGLLASGVEGLSSLLPPPDGV